MSEMTTKTDTHNKRRIFSDTMRALTLAFGLDDKRKHAHAWRVALLAEALGQVYGHPDPALLFHAGLLHDIGTIGFPQHLGHHTPRALASNEARRHPHRGQAILRASALLRPLADIVADHHKRVDEHLRGKSSHPISVSSSIVQLAEQLELSMHGQSAEAVVQRAQECAQRASDTTCHALVCEAALDMVAAGSGWLTHLFTSATASELTARIPDWADLEKYSRRQLLDQLLWTFPRVIDAKHHHTMGHSSRVAFFGFRIAKAIGHATIDRWDVLWAGLLHDVGKVGVPRRVLDRPQRLAFDDYEVLNRHAQHSETILREISALHHIALPASAHHERYDGKGFPQGLTGEEIPLIGRILGIADLYDVLTNNRAFRTELSHAEAMTFLKRQAGRSLDPHIAREAFDVLDNIASAPDCVDAMLEQVQATIRDEGDVDDVLHFVSALPYSLAAGEQHGGPATPAQWEAAAMHHRLSCDRGAAGTARIVHGGELKLAARLRRPNRCCAAANSIQDTDARRAT